MAYITFTVVDYSITGGNMANWRWKIGLNQAISKNSKEFDLTRHEEPCPKIALKRLADEVAKAPPLAHFSRRFLRCKSIAEANRVLDEVYNEADVALVWCAGALIRVPIQSGKLVSRCPNSYQMTGKGV